VRTITFYETASGQSPVEEFLDSLTDQQARKVTWVMRLVEQLQIVPAQYFKKLVGTEHIWEVRVQVGGNIFRILGFMDRDNSVVLTNGFTKKSQKAPPQEIALAEQRRHDYHQRRVTK
jgi:phage-related protein